MSKQGEYICIPKVFSNQIISSFVWYRHSHALISHISVNIPLTLFQLGKLEGPFCEKLFTLFWSSRIRGRASLLWKLERF